MVRIAVRTEWISTYLQRFRTEQREELGYYQCDYLPCNLYDGGRPQCGGDSGSIKSGRTARMISKVPPVLSDHRRVPDGESIPSARLSWGVAPLLLEQKNKAEELFDYAVDTAETAGLISKGDVVVLTAGVPLGVSGTTNLIKVQVAGHILVKGKGIAGKKIAANLCVCHSEEDLANFKEGRHHRCCRYQLTA